MMKILFYENYDDDVLNIVQNENPNLVIKGIPPKYRDLVTVEELPKLIEIEEESIDYKIKRKMEYPSVGDQLDAIFKFLKSLDDKSLPEEVKNYIGLIEEVKNKYPKKNS